MNMNAEQYRKLGREMGLLGIPLEEQDRGNSWQAKAYREGHAGGTELRKLKQDMPVEEKGESHNG